MCEHWGWLLAAAGRALTPCHRDGLGGVATRRGWVPATSDRDMHRNGGWFVKWLRRWCLERPDIGPDQEGTQNAGLFRARC